MSRDEAVVLVVVVVGVSGSFDGGKSEGRVYRELEKVYGDDERTNPSPYMMLKN